MFLFQASLFKDSTVDIVFRSTGETNDLPENGQENVLSITITFTEDVEVSDVFVRACNEGMKVHSFCSKYVLHV